MAAEKSKNALHDHKAVQVWCTLHFRTENMPCFAKGHASRAL
jgi:hypothetical protein